MKTRKIIESGRDQSWCGKQSEAYARQARFPRRSWCWAEFSCPLGSGAGTVLTAVLSAILTAVLSAVVATTGIDELVDFGVAFVLGSRDHRDR